MKKEIVKKPLNIAQRVEILLREGVDSAAWASGNSETPFLLSIIKELCEQVKSLEDQLDAHLNADQH